MARDELLYRALVSLGGWIVYALGTNISSTKPNIELFPFWGGSQSLHPRGFWQGIELNVNIV